MRFTDDHIRIWTGNVSIYISANADPALVDKVVAALQGVNLSAQVGDELAAPDYANCPPFDPSLMTQTLEAVE
jgi:hypothetical protein